MTENNEQILPIEGKIFPKLAKSAFFQLDNNITVANPWSWSDVDKLEVVDLDEYKKAIHACRFFYKRDPIGSTILNKMVDIGVTELDFDRSELTNNEEKLVESIIPALEDFAENMALEFLITGLVVPEIKYTAVTTEELKRMGIKKYSSLILPTSLWLRDPDSIKINAVLADRPSYYVEIPEKMIFFITSKGTYPDGTKDPNLWAYLQTAYPQFVSAVLSGAKEVLLDNPLIFRRRYLSNSPYPIPYLYGALESMKHKRNIRRMDYSIASRVITAVQLIKMGNDEYPLIEDDSEQLDDLKNQMYWRNTGGRDIERIFQLFTNHTVTIEWVFPDVAALLDDAKYKDVNRDIFYALGFPAILVTGETERTAASDAEYAMISPTKTMESFRRKIIKVLNEILRSTFEQNKLKGETELRFSPVNLNSYKDFIEAMTKLYNSGNLSRTSYAKAFGFNLEDEFEIKEEEQAMIEEMDLPEFAPAPFSPQPQQGGQPGKPGLQNQSKTQVSKPKVAKPKENESD